MKTQADNFTYLAPLIAGIAIVLFSSVGIARMMGWGSNSTDDSGDILALDELDPVRTVSETLADARCAECGMFVSMREVESEDTGPSTAGRTMAGSRDGIRVKTTKSYEITIRMADGSTRVIEAANPARWRTGERLIVIGGGGPSNR